MSIYLPNTLHDRIKASGDEINWSEVAQSAFEQKLGEIAATKKNKTMNDVIDRLRASKAKALSEVALLGKEAAFSWCTHQAEYAQLERVAKFRDECGPDFDRVDWSGGALSLAIVKAANGEDRVSRRDIEYFWEGLPGSEGKEYEKEEFLDAFLNGVEEFLMEIEKKL